MKYMLSYEVEAIQWTGHNLLAIKEFIGNDPCVWITPDQALLIGDVRIGVDDWVSCRPDEDHIVVIRDETFCKICRRLP